MPSIPRFQARLVPSRNGLFARIPLIVATSYAAASGLWIVFSDRVVTGLASDPIRLQHLQTYKGTFFITASAILIYGLIKVAWGALLAAWEASHESERRLELALSCAGGGVWEFDVTGSEAEVIFVSPELLERIGLPPDHKLTMMELIERRHPDDLEPFIAAMEAAIESRGAESYDLRHRTRAADGSYRWLHSRGNVVCDADGVPIRIIGVTYDVNDEMRARQRVTELLRYDAVTGLPNPTTFVTACDERIADLSGGEMIGVVQIHPTGLDALLGEEETQEDAKVVIELAERLKRLPEPGMLIGRANPGVFVLATPPVRSLDAVHALLREALDALGEPIVVGDSARRITFAVGGAVHPQDGGGAAVLLRKARNALDALPAGPDTRVRWFTEGLDAEFRRRAELVRALAEAVPRGEIVCHYQPLIDLASMRTVGFEALARWRRSDGTLVPPAEFIPLAERTGHIRALGEEVLRQALAAAASWQRPDRAPCFVAVNVSPLQLEDPAFPGTVARLLGAANLSANRLELEVTESALAEDPEAVAERLAALRRLGVSIAIDDFGTGYSSFALLGRLPFNRLKIDRTFVAAAETGDTAILDTIVDLCRRLSLGTTAEGVETALQAERLERRGVELAQGYHFSRPVPRDIADEFVGRLWRPEVELLRAAAAG